MTTHLRLQHTMRNPRRAARRAKKARRQFKGTRRYDHGAAAAGGASSLEQMQAPWRSALPKEARKSTPWWRRAAHQKP